MSADLFADMLGWLTVALGAVALGLVWLLSRRTRKTNRWSLALAMVVFGLAAAGAVLLEQSWQVVGSLAGLAVLIPVVALFRANAERVAVVLSALLSRPYFHGAALLIAGLALGATQLTRMDQALANEVANTDHILSALETVELVAEEALIASTDQGASIPLYAPSEESLTPTTNAHERQFLHDLKLDLNLLRTGSPDSRYNCHGWVFGGGRCWIRGAAVNTILQDNGYQVVSRPAPGDVAIFRNGTGEVAHTALVRMVTADGVILLESKWGKLGRYIHTATQHGYASCSCTYYHSQRGSHVVRGLELERTTGGL